jgi:predicted extracellular nuclease
VLTSRRAPGRPLVIGLIAALAVSILPGSQVRPARAAPTELFFSEYIEGSSNNKALEIFNGTGASINLAADVYNVQMYFNGNVSAGLTINLTGSVADGDVFVVAQSDASSVILAQADQTNGAGWFNGDDAVVLRKGTTVIDSIGQIGFDPGSQWGADLTSTADNTLRRKDAIEAGDPNGADAFDPSVEWDGFASDTFNGLGVHPGLVPDDAPSVLSTVPANGAVDVASSSNISITFSEPVNASAASFSISCPPGGTAQPFALTGGPTTYTLDPSSDLPASGSCGVVVIASQVTDVDANDPPDNMLGSVSFSFAMGTPADPCEDPFTSIPQIQGVDDIADVTGVVTTEGVVVSDDEGPSPALRGFYLQDPVGDGDAATSDGIFVFNGNDNEVALGDSLRVTGTASEFQGQTQISASTIVDCGDASVEPIDVTFPVATMTTLEQFEGMLVRLPQTMYVTEHFQLGRFGQVLLSSGDRLKNPTAIVDPGAPAIAYQAANNLNKILVDDSSQAQNPDPILFARGGQPLSASNTLRGGDTATGIVGVMTYTWGGNNASPNAYRVRPLNALNGGVAFVAVNERPGPTVEVDGTARVVGMNLLNYFNTFDGLPDTVDNCTFGVGGAPADCRGADTQEEFDRQWPKTVAAIVGMDADVIGVNEIENDGYGANSAIAHLVDRLNDATDPGTYAFIDVDAETGQTNAAGTDAIKVGFIYRVATVAPVGDTAVLNTDAFVNGGDPAPRSRPSLAQTFETVDGARFIVDVNHLKSKGSACAAPDAGDGQGNCNQVRTNAAIELAAWLATDPTGTGDDDILIVGDLNSYAMEDPVRTLEDAGFTNLVAAFVEDPYSYVFDGQWGYLDYALGSSSAVAQVADIVEWHIDSDEPSVLDYNLNFKTPNLQTTLYAPDRFRVSDHDPIVVGLDADSDRPIVEAGGPYQVVEGGSVLLTAVGSDPTGDELSFAWDFDGDGFDDGTGASVVFDAAGLEALLTFTVSVRLTDEHGQSATDSATVNVIWDFGGFSGPVHGRPAVDVAKAGSAVVVKFDLGGDQGLGILAAGYPASAAYSCDGTPPLDATTPTEGPGLSYSASDGLYQYAWKTDKAWANTCRTFVLGLDDGTKHYVDVQFKP